MLPSTLFKLYDPNLMDNLTHLPEMCVFGLVHEPTKTMLLFRTKNIVTALSRIINEYKYSNNKVLKLPLIVFEEIKDSNNLWVRYNYWGKYYSDLDYVILNRCKYNIKYKLRTQILGDFRKKYNSLPMFYVKVVSRRYKEVIVGIFDKVDDMNSFLETHYPNNRIDNITYSNNSLTKEYYAGR